MNSVKLSLIALLFSVLCTPTHALISVGNLSKEEAAELGITMKHRKNGDAGVKVWLEFKKEGFLEKLTYCSLRMTTPKGEHLLSAMLQPNPVHHRQPKDVVSVAFSAAPESLENCAFMIVAYGSTRGDVGYLLHVKDFINTSETTIVPAAATGARPPSEGRK